MKNILASTQSSFDNPAVHAVELAARGGTEQRGLEASLILANAQIADLKGKLKGSAEKERKYLAGELHDDVQQILFGLSLNMAASRGEAATQMPPDFIGGWMHTVQTVMEHLDQLIAVLRSPVISGQKLPGAMRSYVKTLSLAPEQTVLFEAEAELGTVAPNVAIACFRVVQEALGNAIKHSGARNLQVRLGNSVNRLTVSIRDDGVGFNVKDACQHALYAGSVGLSSMRERVTLAGGHFDVQSSIGHGTRIRASFPIEVRRQVLKVRERMARDRLDTAPI